MARQLVVFVLLESCISVVVLKPGQLAFSWEESEERAKCLSGHFNLWDMFRYHKDRKSLKAQANHNRIF